MITVSQKTIEGLDKKYGRRWIVQPVIEALGGAWPLESGWKESLVGNSVSLKQAALDKLVAEEAGKSNEEEQPKKKYNLVQKSTVHRTPLGVELTEEQMACAEPLCKLNKPMQTLGGLAGTGKTTLISYMTGRLRKFACCAFTGRAAEVLRSKGIEASTIHSLIYIPTEEKTSDGMPVFRLREKLDVDGIIVDEASMVGPALYKDLMSFGLPTIFVGDHGQLEPVGEDMYLMRNPDYKLETVHRNAGDIALFAHHLRDGKPAHEFKSSEIIKIIQKRDCVQYLLDMDQIICARNDTRVAINKYVRELKGLRDPSPVKGDRIISLMNSKKLGIYNGTQGDVRTVSPMRMSALMDNGKSIRVKWDVSTFNSERPVKDIIGIHPFDYAYAVTCHKAQGGEWSKVMVLEQVCSLWDHRRWAYTAASRAREQLIWILPV